MAQNQNTSSTDPTTFIKGMIKDVDDSYFPEGSWYHARNAVNTSKDGNEGTIGNETSNTYCNSAPYPIIGVIHLNADRWAIFSTDNNNSEIGLFIEDTCTYIRVAVDFGNTCLKFSQNYIIIGVAKENFDCTWQVYWADALNPDRTLNMDKPAFLETCITVNGCQICSPVVDPVHLTPLLDCDKLRLAPLVTVPCVSVSRGPNGGSILNGSYYAVVAYVLNGQRVTDYYMPSNTQAIFEHDNVSGSLLITINQMDTNHFDNFELVIVRTVNSQTSAKRIGTYSTRQSQISLDIINEALPTIPVEFIPLRSPNYERSDGIFEIGNYMLRTGPRAKFDFNYQPLANHITARWKAVAYPSNYYAKGGNATGYMRDEVYPFFIRWVYNTGEKSSSYTIPGRPSRATDLGAAPVINSIEIIDPIAPYIPQKWEVLNTATVTAFPNTTQADGGILIAEGEMAYWQSTESYPDKKPEVFNSSDLRHPWTAITIPPYAGTSIPQYDLCGNPIRHHKFPENKISPHFRPDPANVANQQIVVLGVEFDNILPPLDNQGNLIPGIVGYEILRGSREGNKVVVAKGIINNMRTYQLDNGQTGLYQNYPYNPLGADPSLTPTENQGENPLFTDHGPLSGVSRNQFTFHSPDTSFNSPFLSSKELKLYGELYGNVQGNFDESPKHPKEKLLTDISFVVASFIGIGAAILAMQGKKTRSFSQPIVDRDDHGTQVYAAGTGTGLWGVNDVVGLAALLAAQGVLDAAVLPVNTAFVTAEGLGASILSLAFTGQDLPLDTYRNAITAIAQADTTSFQQPRTDVFESTEQSNMPLAFQVLSALPVFSHYWTLGTQAAWDLIEAIVPYTQYAMRYTSHGFMNNYAGTTPAQFRYFLDNSLYLNDGFQEFGQNSNAKINNINRGKTVALQVRGGVGDPTTVTDNTAQTIGSSQALRSASGSYNGAKGSFTSENAKVEFTTQAISHYAGLKNRIRNQYGQLDGVIQVPASYCSINVGNLVAGTIVTPSGIVNNGDIYVGRYTEKNTFFYFWDWLYNQPDGYEFNYKLRYMLNYPRYWANFDKFDPGEFLNSFIGSILTLSFSAIELPSKHHSLDGPFLPPGLSFLFTAIFRVTQRYFYLFQSGVRDFYVESEVCTDLRDWEDPIEKRYYDPYRFTDLRALFEPSIIKSGNFFKYDQSLSISRVFNNFFSWGNLQTPDYDPQTAATCFTYYKKRVIYSLPQNLEAKKDFWRVFLANNYKDFKSKVTAVEPVNKNGAMFFFTEQAPIMYQGVDTLQTDLGTKITIGDGGLFSQPEQAVVNANESYEYGSCQNRLSVANTPVGLFWISENQGKILRYSGSVKELSAINMKFWFSRYLPYAILGDFPNYDLLDNPVAGVGCQTIFNNRDTVLYFTKKDFHLLPNLAVTVIYNPLGSLNPGFFANGLPITLGDPLYFEDASWTISFDPKNETWQSFHDWHPDLMMPSKTHHLTIVKNPANINKVGEIWKHTDSQLSFCNFYGKDFPWEIDYVAQTGQTVNTLRSIEYFMEANIYNNDETDFFHVLDWNFDHSIIYNSEQVSGVLVLTDTPKNDVAGRLLYPKIGPTSIDILFEKEEQKYRLNQFWDITADRGEFTFPNVQRPIWQTQSNGYIRSLNPANLNYQKDQMQRKKFRHYATHVSLYKNVSKNVKMLMKLSNNKNLVSLR